VPATVLPTAAAPEPLVAVAPAERSAGTNTFIARPPGFTRAAVENPASESGSLWLWAIGGGGLAAAAFVVWLTTRVRRLNPSVITAQPQPDHQHPARGSPVAAPKMIAFRA
jgi:hypothetical protein